MRLPRNLTFEQKDQMQKVLADPKFAGDSRAGKILRYLIKAEQEGSSHAIDIKRISLDVFAGKSDDDARAGLKYLVRQLDAYYGPKGAGADESIRLRVETRKVGLDFEAGNPRAYPAVARALANQSIDDSVECLRLGNKQTALKHVVENLHLLRRLRDTHFRYRRGRRSFMEPTELMATFRENLREFLQRSPTNQLQLIAGPRVEEKYVSDIANAAQGNEERVEAFRLQAGGWLNFAILDYSDHRPTEVLFGWDRVDDATEEAVFLTSDRKLVDEFINLYSKLIAQSEPLASLRDLFVPARDADESATVTRWRDERIYALLQNLESGLEVRMLTTLFVDWEKMLPLVKDLRARGVHVKIVMMDPTQKSLVKARFERRSDRLPPIALRNLKEQLAQFRTLAAEQSLPGSLEVRTTNIMPFGFFVQCGADIVMGLLPPLSAYHQCPMIQVEADSMLGKELEKNWFGYWSVRSSAEVKQLESDTDIREVWLAIPKFSKESSKRSEFKSVVRRNSRRGVKYTVIIPKRLSPAEEREYQEFQRLFPTRRGSRKPRNLAEIPLDFAKFRRLIPDQNECSVIVFNPRGKDSEEYQCYAGMPGEPLWRRLEGAEAKTTLTRFARTVNRRSTESRNLAR